VFEIPSGRVAGVSVSKHRGTGKSNVGFGFLVAGWGLEGDAHAGTERQVSVFSAERARDLTAGMGIEVRAGDFAENIALSGMDLSKVKPGDRLLVGEAILQVSEIGKHGGDGHSFSFHGLAPLMTEGVYCRVVQSGMVKVGDQAGFLADGPR